MAIRQLWPGAPRLRLFLMVAAISVITLAASSQIVLGAGVSRRSAAVGNCSIAAASKAATAAHFDVDPGLGKTPINHVICGPFLGRGSQAMAAMVAVPTGCGVSIGWAVFRFAGGVWHLVMKQENGALRLQPVGSDIRETQGYPRRGDAYCNPSRMRTRIWHWNGSRFVASPWKVTSSPRSGPKTVHLFYVRSPSHNLWCDVGDEGKAYCVSKDLPHSATLALDGTLRICNGRRCVTNNNLFKSGTPVLAYGQRDEQGGYRCKSEQSGINCTVILAGKGYSKGFLINRAGVRRVGP